MRRGFKCKKNVLEDLKRNYESIVRKKYKGCYLDALKNFDKVSESNLRNILGRHYPNQRSRDQAWKTCKGSLYEYAVFKYIESIIGDDVVLHNKVTVSMGDEALATYKDQIVIRNWSDIIPDADILLIEKDTNNVLAILSCKTSLRERLTETAFWKRELERVGSKRKIKLIFVTTDKDNELRTDTNRYILLHVIDYTFLTDPDKYEDLIKTYKKKYGEREDFNQLLRKIKFIDRMGELIRSLVMDR